MQAHCRDSLYSISYLRQLSTPLYFPAKYALINGSSAPTIASRTGISDTSSGLGDIPFLELFVPSLSPRAVELLKVLSLSASDAISHQQLAAAGNCNMTFGIDGGRSTTMTAVLDARNKSSVFSADVVSQLLASHAEERQVAQSNVTVCTAAAIGCNAYVGKHVEKMANIWSNMTASCGVQLEKAGVESADVPEIFENLMNISQRLVFISFPSIILAVL